MAGKVAEVLQGIIQEDQLATAVANLWQEMSSMRAPWVTQTMELRDYVFATDTTTTTNKTLPWKNSTTLPKLSQIRDNLHANYMAALFPNDDWLRWEAYTQEDDQIEKKEAIEAYMSNKLRQFGFQEIVSRLIYDYIDYGNCFGDAEYRVNHRENEEGEQEIVSQGPVALRRSPYDIVFNLIAPSFDESYHMVRHIKTLGELERDIAENPEAGYLKAALDEQIALRAKLASFNAEDIDKASGIQIDGFGSYATYLQTDYIELIEFRGDIRDRDENEYLSRHIITIMDRTKVIRKTPMPSWLGKSTLVHGGWRYRPDNLMAMGPLDNLVGMQYRIDHLENIKADLFDLIAQPPLLIRGQVEEFDWEPLAQIVAGEDGEVIPLQLPAQALMADTEIAILEQKMDEFAGAPKQAIGARTPGEKTAFEVQILEQNASKMFQEKVVSFEINVLEPLLNNMLEIAKRNLDGADLIGVQDTDLGVKRFLEISKADLASKGKIRPVGARHFALRAQLVQNYQGFRAMFAEDPSVMNHISGVGEAQMFEDLLGYERYDLVRPNVRLEEQAESQRLLNSLQNQLEEEQLTPIDEDEQAAMEDLLANPQEGEV